MRTTTTIRHVASEASVSIGTVSRVLNNNPSVTPDVRERVMRAVHVLRYQPNAVAQSMRRKDTRVIGCAVTTISHPIFADMVSAAEELFRENGYAMVFGNTHDDPSTEIELFRFFRHRRVDGLLTTLGREDNDRVLETLKDISMPVVLWERELGGDYDTVVGDHGHGCYQAAEYLIKQGHRRIALITGPEQARPGRVRVRDFKRAHSEHGLPTYPELIICQPNNIEYGFHNSYSLLSSNYPPTAVIAGVQEIVGILKAVRILNVRVPDALSIVAFGDSDFAGLVQPPITVVRWDSHQIGRMGAELMLRRLENPSELALSPRHVVLPTELILRGSCAPPAT